MDIITLRELFDRHLRYRTEFPSVRRVETDHTVRYVRDDSGRSFVLYHRFDPADEEWVVAGEIEYFTGRGTGFEWKVFSHDQPPGLAARLGERGFELEEEEKIMLLDLEQMPPDWSVPPPDSIRRIDDPAQLSTVQAILEQVWGTSFAWVHERLGAHLHVPDYLEIYLAEADGQPASVGWIYFHPGTPFADIWAGSTLPQYRGRGLYTALLAVRAQSARTRGYRYLTIDAGEMSAPIVARHGFRQLTTAQSCFWKGPEHD